MDEQFEIEVFRPGTFTPMSGTPLTFSAETLSAIADAYDPAGAPAPAVVGHPTTDAPAFGWASGFHYDGERERLIATVGDLAPAFAEAVRAKTYRNVSMSFHAPEAAANPKPGTWYPKHIGFLGGAAPAVPGLKLVSFSGKPEDVVTIEFGEPGFRDAASLFRRMRDWMIEQAGLEKADEVLPHYEIEWLSRQADDPAPGFSAPNDPEDQSLKNPPADFAAREAALAARERQLATRDTEARHAEHESFAEGLVKDNVLLPVKKAEVVGLLDALAGLDKPVEASFADASGRTIKEGAVETLKRLLKDAPKVVPFGELPRGDFVTGAPDASFAAPDGFSIDKSAMDLHARASAFQATHPNTSWMDAVRAAQAGR